MLLKASIAYPGKMSIEEAQGGSRVFWLVQDQFHA
jgi:hypothetical protein